MSNSKTLQPELPDDVIIARRSTLANLIHDAVNASLKEAVEKFQALLSTTPLEKEERPISLKEGAALLGIALPTMYSKISKREFSSYKKGKKVYVYKSELMAYLNSGKRKNRQEIINSSSGGRR